MKTLVLGRGIKLRLGTQHDRPLRRVHGVPEDVAVTAGAERGRGRAVALRAEPPAPAAGAVGPHEP